MKKHKILLALLPVVTMLTFPSCNKQCVVTLKTGAGSFIAGEVEISFKVHPGTKLSQLSISQPTSFFFENMGQSMLEAAYPIGWANKKGVIHEDYVFTGNTTIEARYFHSQELAINAVENVLNYTVQDVLRAVTEEPYKSQVISTYQDIVTKLRSSTSEVQTCAFLIGSQSDLGVLKRAMMNHRDSQIAVLQQCRNIFFSLCSQINNQLSETLGKTFAALFDAMGEAYDSKQTEHVEWFNHFGDKLKHVLLDAPDYAFRGAESFEQGALGASKRMMLNNKESALAPLNNLFDLYHAAFFECRTDMQAEAIGKMGAAMSDASAENYPKGYNTFYELSKKEINEILHWGA